MVSIVFSYVVAVDAIENIDQVTSPYLGEAI